MTMQEAGQMSMDERVIDDPALREIAMQWAAADKERKALNGKIKALGIDEIKEKVGKKVDDLGEVTEPTLYRIADTGIVISVRPPGEPSDVEFTTTPKRQIRLKVDGEE